ncbi:unnamed protein product [Mytilus coruscus]|uniref:Retrotransposon gag domain-containing protein n=1 Tax=Mytilus coruscus TaxID=42192 RepID=A0A6J8EZ24_MYTCO|nr:unnamed protein product [Mytilus coruscus]
MTAMDQLYCYGAGFSQPSQIQMPITPSNTSRPVVTNKASTTPLKSLKYDGTEKGDDWVSFLGKFEMYAEMSGLSEEDKRAHLCWAVTGNAARFCHGRVRRNKNISYAELIKCMEKRFNLRKLTETVRIQFQSARQSPGEDLDDWAKRLLSLADKAFGDLPDEFLTSEVITKLCHGCEDKNAGSTAASFRPKSVDEALERIKWQQYNDKGDSQEPNSENCEDVIQVNNVKIDSQQQLVNSIDKLTENVDRNLKTIQSNIGEVQNQVDKNIQAVQSEMRGMERKWKDEMESMKEYNVRNKKRQIKQHLAMLTPIQHAVCGKNVCDASENKNFENKVGNYMEKTSTEEQSKENSIKEQDTREKDQIQPKSASRAKLLKEEGFDKVSLPIQDNKELDSRVDNKRPMLKIPLTTVQPATELTIENPVEHFNVEKTVTDGSERTFTTMQLGNSSLLRLSLELGDTPLVQL